MGEHRPLNPLHSFQLLFPAFGGSGGRSPNHVFADVVLQLGDLHLLLFIFFLLGL